MDASKSKNIKRRQIGGNVWLAIDNPQLRDDFAKTSISSYKYEVSASEEAVGKAMYRILGREAESGKLTKFFLICTFLRRTRSRR